MGIPAMARVTKLSEELLSALSRSNPVFAPGAANYVAMGGVRSLWQGDLRAALRDALANAPIDDRRAQDGLERGGRLLAAEVARRVLDAA
jgi:malonate decarboxylase gamma subunit